MARCAVIAWTASARAGFVIAKEVNGKHYATYGTWTDRTRDQRWTDNGAGTPHCACNGHRPTRKRPGNGPEAQGQGRQGVRRHVGAGQTVREPPVPGREAGAGPWLPHTARPCCWYRSPTRRKGAVSTLQRIFPEWNGKNAAIRWPHKRCCFPINGNEDRIFICEGSPRAPPSTNLTWEQGAGGLQHVQPAARGQVGPGEMAQRKDHPRGPPTMTTPPRAIPASRPPRQAAEAIGAEVVVP